MDLPALQVRCVSPVHLDHPSSLRPFAPGGGAAGSPASHQISGFLKGGLGPASASCSATLTYFFRTVILIRFVRQTNE